MPAKSKKRKLPKSWTTITPLSKTIAFILFIVLPFVGFYFGMQYQKTMDQALGQVQYIIPLHSTNK